MPSKQIPPKWRQLALHRANSVKTFHTKFKGRASQGGLRSRTGFESEFMGFESQGWWAVPIAVWNSKRNGQSSRSRATVRYECTCVYLQPCLAGRKTLKSEVPCPVIPCSLLLCPEASGKEPPFRRGPTFGLGSSISCPSQPDLTPKYDFVFQAALSDNSSSPTSNHVRSRMPVGIAGT
jgi:hypothetical protein